MTIAVLLFCGMSALISGYISYRVTTWWYKRKYDNLERFKRA
jgi:hypothetical protein